jgi:hypothetical protein
MIKMGSAGDGSKAYLILRASFITHLEAGTSSGYTRHARNTTPV